MIKLISKILIKEYDNFECPNVKEFYGKLCSFIGICINVLLFIIKFLCGLISGSVSIMADGFNNLSDAGTSVIALIGFFIASIGAGKRHPFGHGRFEWIMGMFSSVIIIVLGIECFFSSIKNIKNPTELEFNYLVCIILICSIVAKLYMYIYNSKIGKKIGSVSMKAVAADSISDMVSTALIFSAILIEHYTGIHIDGWCGILVSIFIFVSGIKSISESIELILGQVPNDDLFSEIKGFSKEYKEIYNISNINIHDYGMGHMIVSMHIEGIDEEKRNKLSYIAYDIEKRLYVKYKCETTIQIDILDFEKEKLEKLKNTVEKTIRNLNICAAFRECKIIPLGEEKNKIILLIACYHMQQKKESQLQKKLEYEIKKQNNMDFVQTKFVLEVMHSHKNSNDLEMSL